jgi:hypothetical protein
MSREDDVGNTIARGECGIHRRKYLGVAAAIHLKNRFRDIKSDREYLTHDSPSYSVGDHSPAEAESRLQHQKRTLGNTLLLACVILGGKCRHVLQVESRGL